MLLQLTSDELLTTTRAVRKRLDLTRPVERKMIEECITIAQQAPTASNMQNWHLVVVTDSAKRTALADLWRRGLETYMALPSSITNVTFDDPERNATQARIISSAQYLFDHIHEVPVMVIPCIAARTDDQPMIVQSAVWGSIAPAAWSFMLAARARARARGLGTSWTTFHLFFEEEAAKILSIPHAEIMQICLIPVAYTKGTNFKPAPREPVDTMVHWDAW